MPITLPFRVPSRSDWVRRCAARIRELDDVVSLLDAADLANTLRDLPGGAALDPEVAAARLFQDPPPPPLRMLESHAPGELEP